MKLQEPAVANALIGVQGGITIEATKIDKIPLECGLIFIVGITFMDLINELCIMIICFKGSGLIGILALITFVLVLLAYLFFIKKLFLNAVQFDRQIIVRVCMFMTLTKVYMFVVMIISLFAASQLRALAGYWIFYYIMSTLIWLYITFQQNNLYKMNILVDGCDLRQKNQANNRESSYRDVENTDHKMETEM